MGGQASELDITPLRFARSVGKGLGSRKVGPRRRREGKVPSGQLPGMWWGEG